MNHWHGQTGKSVWRERRGPIPVSAALSRDAVSLGHRYGQSWGDCEPSPYLHRSCQKDGDIHGAMLGAVFDFFLLSLFVGCLTSQQHASVSQGWICSDNCTCCHTEMEVADQTFCLNQSLYILTSVQFVPLLTL